MLGGFYVSRKVVGFLVFAATSISFVGTAIVRQEQLLFSILSVVLTIFALAALKNHFKELQ